jgi:hypothetical protein
MVVPESVVAMPVTVMPMVPMTVMTMSEVPMPMVRMTVMPMVPMIRLSVAAEVAEDGRSGKQASQ